MLHRLAINQARLLHGKENGSLEWRMHEILWDYCSSRLLPKTTAHLSCAMNRKEAMFLGVLVVGEIKEKTCTFLSLCSGLELDSRNSELDKQIAFPPGEPQEWVTMGNHIIPDGYSRAA